MQDDPQLVLALEESERTGIRVLGLRMSMYALGFIASTLIARGLGPEGRGLYALPVAYLGIVIVVSHLGLEHANVHLAGRKEALGHLWWNSTVAAVLIGVLAWSLVVAAYLVTDGRAFGGVPALWIAVVMFQVPFLLGSLFWAGLLQLAGHLRSAIRASLAGAFVQAALCAVLFATGSLTTFRALLLLWATNGVTWLLLLGLSHRRGLTRGSFDGATLRRAIAFGIRAYVALVLVFLLFRIDQVIVQRLLGFRALGLYSLAVVLAELVWLLTDPFAATLLPHQVRAGGGDERRLGYAAARLNLSIAIVAGVVAWLVAPYAIPLVFGHEYAGAVWPFRLLLPGAVAFSVQRPLAQVLLKEGRLAFVTVFNALALVFNVAANLVLLPAMGVAGAGIASTLTYGGVAAAYVFATRKAGVAGWRDLRPGLRELSRLRRGFA